MKRALLKFGVALGVIVLAVLLIAGTALTWTVGSESGLRFAWDRVAPRLPPEIEVGAVEGRLTGPLTLSDIELRTDTLHVRVERAELRWHPGALLRRTLDIERLAVRGVDVIQFPAEQPRPEPDQAFELPERIGLPVAIRIGEASVETLRHRSSPDAEALLVERVSLAGYLDDDELVLRDLVVRSPLLDVSGEASIVPRDVYATSGMLNWVLRPPEYPEAHGSTRFSGSAEALTIEQRIDAPYEARAEVLVEQPFVGLRVDGQLELAVQPAAFGIEAPTVDAVDSTLSFRGTLDRLDLDAAAELSGGQADGVAVELQARYAPDALEIATLDVVVAESSAAIHASGRLTMGAEQPVLDLDMTWSQLQWPLRGAAQVASESGSLELRGTLNAYTAALEADLALADGTAGKARATGSGNTQALALEQIDIEVLRGRVTGRADASWAPTLAGAVDLTADGLDPGVLASTWPGRLGARVRADGALDGPNVTLTVHELAVNGRLRDRDVELTTRGGYATDTLRLDSLKLRAGSSELDARGTADRDVAIEWHLESPDLGDFWPGLAGRVSARGALDGPRLEPQVSVDAHAQALQFMGFGAEEIVVDADVDIAGQAHSTLDVSVTAAKVQGTDVQQLQLTGAGTAARHDLALTATTSVGNAELDAGGSITDPWTPRFAWSFELDTATLTYAELPAWQLREPARGRVTKTEAELAQTCWQSGMANLCIEGARSPDRIDAEFALSQLPFGYLAALLAGPVQLEGELGIEGTFAQPSNGWPELDVQIRSSPGRLARASPDPLAPADSGGADEPYALAFGPADGRVTMRDDRIDGSLRVPFAEQGELAVGARVGAGAGAAFERRSLDGELSADVASLDFVADIVNELQDTRGAIRGDLEISGTVGEPRIAGTLTLEDGRATWVEPNVDLEDLELALAGDGASGVTVEAQARSGGGTVTAEGRLALAAAGPQGRITVNGEAFEVIDTLDAQVLLSPDLDFVFADDRMELTGTVRVPHARLTPREAEESVITASSDQVIVGSGEEASAVSARPFSAKVRLELGDDVTVEGYGLTGRLGGAIDIIEVPGEPTTGSGELRVEPGGVYEAYGQKLEIETGRLLFAGGPIERPGVNIEAVRRPAEGILVGARVRGLLDAPELTVFSEPPMPQQEQLSYLVLGRPLESTSESESSAMSQAALALGLKGGNFVSERVNENLGLDEFGIQTEPGEAPTEAAFVIGKYLTPSLYVSYGIGLFEPVNTLKLRYTVSKRWRFVTESSSEASGGDVIYNIERSKKGAQ